MWACLARMKSDLTGWTLSPGLGFFILDRLANIAAGDDPEDREDEERDTLDDEADEEEDEEPDPDPDPVEEYASGGQNALFFV